MFVVVISKSAINGNHNEYMRQDGLAKREGRVRTLFSSDKDELTLAEANQHLSNGQGRPQDGVNFEIVISLKDESIFKRLSADEEKAKVALRDSVRDGLNALFIDLGVRDVRWTAAIHLNTDQPHVHVAVAPDCINIKTGNQHRLTDIPRAWKLSKDGAPSRAASYFEKSLETRFTALRPQIVNTIPASYVTSQQMPPKALNDAIGRSEQERVQTFLTEEKELSPSIVQEQLEIGTIYAAQHGYCVFVHRDPEGNVTGGTARGKTFGKDGFFYIGDLRTATRFVLVDTPGEALSLYDLTKERDLSNVAFVSLSNAVPRDELLNLIGSRNESIRVVWARGLDESGQQKIDGLEDSRARLTEIAARTGNENEISVVTFAPNKTYGETWNSQLIHEHMRGELESIENSLTPVAEAQNSTVTDAQKSEPESKEQKPIEADTTTAIERSASTFLSSLPLVKTLPTEPDILDGTRAFKRRVAEREAARTRQEKDESVRTTSVSVSTKHSSERLTKEEEKQLTKELRELDLEPILHAHGLSLRPYNGEKVYTDAPQKPSFAIKITDELFSDRKDGMLGGKGAIDLVMHLQGVDFRTARSWLIDNYMGGEKPKLAERPKLKDVEDEPKPLLIHPPNQQNLDVVRNYLINTRGLSPVLVDYCISMGTLYANSMKSCVFLHRDPEGHITGAEWRSTDSHLRGTASGTEKQQGWFFLGDLRTATRYVVVEAPIDTLSYIELHKDEDISKTCFVSLNGATIPKTLLEYIANRTREIETVELIWALDNNPIGAKSREAADKSFQRTMHMLDSLETGPLVHVVREEPVEKDWNDQLLASKGLKPYTVKPQAQPDESAPKVDESAPNAIKSVRSRETISSNFSVSFNDGRFGWVGRAEDENHARELATAYRTALEARGTQVNNNGIYKEGVSTVIVPFGKKDRVKAEIYVVEDRVDGKWRIGVNAEAGNTGWSYAPGVFGNSYDSQAAALVAGARRITRTFEEHAPRTDVSEELRRALKSAIKSLKIFELQQGATLENAPDEIANRLPQSNEEGEQSNGYYKIVGKVKDEEGHEREVYWHSTAWSNDEAPDVEMRAGAWCLIKGTHFKTADAAFEVAESHGLTVFTVQGFNTLSLEDGSELTEDVLRQLSEDELIARLESAPDFSYEAEKRELTRRLDERGLDWRWTTITASTGVVNVIEAFPIGSIEHEQAENDRKSESDVARIPGVVDRDGSELSGGTEAEGVPATRGEGRVGNAVRDNGGGHGEGVIDDAGEGTEFTGVSDSSAGVDAARSAGAGGLGERVAGGGGLEPSRDISEPEPARNDAGVDIQIPIIYARITNDKGDDSDTRSRSFEEAKRAAENFNLTINGRYVSGTREQVEAASNALESIESRARIVILTHPDDIILARTNGYSDWQLSLYDFTARRHINAIDRYRRGIERNQRELIELGDRKTKRREELTEQIRFWQRVVDNPEGHLEANLKGYVRSYEAIVHQAISKGFPVPKEIIESNPLFRKAATARERYEKGRNTSFGNKSGIIDDSMQEERGYKVKRQDGKKITEEQVKEIAAGMDEIEKVIGSVRDIMRAGDVTIAHTNGKRPFLTTDASGMYHPDEKTITVGTCNKITGSTLPALAHEVGHFLDEEAGAANNVEVRIFSKSGRRSSRVVSYLSEGDNKYFSDSQDDNLINDARACMIRSREIERILNNTDKSAPREVQIAREFLSIRLGRNYTQTSEIWARLFEQYIATSLEGSGQWSVDADYTNTLGFWSREDFERLIPRIEAQIEKRLALVRSVLTPEAARVVTEAEVKEEINDQSQQQVELSEQVNDVSTPQNIQTNNERSEAQLIFEELLNAMPVGTSFEIAGESVNGLSGRWVRVEEDGQPAWRAEHDGNLNGHYRESADFYAVGVGDVQAEVNTLYTLIEEADGGIELLELASVEAEYLAQQSTEPQTADTDNATEEIPIAVGLISESAYHRWLRSAHGINHLRATDLTIYEKMRYRVQYLAARVRGEAPAQQGEDIESAEYRERLENALPQAIADDARYKGGKVTETSIRMHQRLRGVLDGLQSLDNKLTVEYPKPVVENEELETRDVAIEEKIESEAGREVEFGKSPLPETEVSKIPLNVRKHVDFHLARLRAADEQLRIAEELDARTDSGTRYQDEAWSKYKEESHESRKALTEFITSAMQNSVDGAQVLEELGGFPPTVKARMMQDDAASREDFETIPTRLVIDGNTVKPVIEAREQEQLEQAQSAIRHAQNVVAANSDPTTQWTRGDWPPVDVEAFFESPYGNEDDDPYAILNEALRLQVQRKFFIPLAEAALERGIDPSTGREFRERARTQFEHDLLEARNSMEATFDEVDAVMGRACGDELRRRVDAVQARSKEALVADTVRELSENEQARTIFERNRQDAQNCLIALTRFIDDHISMGLSASPSPVEVAEYNIALTTPGFFLEVAEKLHGVYVNYKTELEDVQVRTSTPEDAADGLLFEIGKDSNEPPKTSYLQIVGKSGQPAIPLTVRHAVYGWRPLNKQFTLWGGLTQNMEWQQRYLSDCGHAAREIDAETARLLSAENVTVFRSGVSAITDLNGYADAGAPVGVVVGRLTQPAIDRLVDYNRDGGRVFIDSGEFGAFKAGTTISFDVVLAQYDAIFERMENKASLSLVMPDKIGDQARSIELLREHKERVLNYIRSGADVVIPIQRGERSLSEAYSEIVEILGTNDFRVAIPSNQKAVPQEELTAFLAESEPARIHLLGISEANSRFSSLVTACVETLPGIDISADANRLRAIVGANRKLTNRISERIDELAYQAVWDGDTELVIEDETEALYGIYNTPQYFTPEQAAAFARYLTSDADQQRRITEAATNPDAPEAGELSPEATQDPFDAPIEYGSHLGYVLEDLFPGDRAYRYAIFDARQQMARDQLSETDVPAAIRQEEITSIERESQKKLSAKPITYRTTEVYGERVVIADVVGHVRMPKHLEGHNIKPEVAQVANSLKDGQYFIVENTLYVRVDDRRTGKHYQNFIPLLIMRESGASVYALNNFERGHSAEPRAATEFAARLRQDSETVKVLMSEVLDKDVAGGQQKVNDAQELPEAPKGWTLKSTTANQKTQHYLASERFKGYRIALYNDEGRWIAEILTRQTSGGRESWEPARKSFSGTIEAVVRETERRGLYWEEQDRARNQSREEEEGATLAEQSYGADWPEKDIRRSAAREDASTKVTVTPHRLGLRVMQYGQPTFKELIGAGEPIGIDGLIVPIKGTVIKRDTLIRFLENRGETNELFIGGEKNPAIQELSVLKLSDKLAEIEAAHGLSITDDNLIFESDFAVHITPKLKAYLTANVPGAPGPIAIEIEWPALSAPAQTATQDFIQQLPSNSEGLAFIRVTGGLGEPSEDYAGFNWNPMSDNSRLWFGPEDHTDWIQGKLESAGYNVDLIDERTFRSLTTQFDSQCYDRRGWTEINWRNFYESRYYYSSEDPDPYLALDMSVEEQQARTRAIHDGLESLQKNIDPDTSRPFKAKAREKFEKRLKETWDAFNGLYAEVYSAMGEHIEAELHQRVQASVGAISEEAEAYFSGKRVPSNAVAVNEEITEQATLFAEPNAEKIEDGKQQVIPEAAEEKAEADLKERIRARGKTVNINGVYMTTEHLSIPMPRLGEALNALDTTLCDVELLIAQDNVDGNWRVGVQSRIEGSYSTYSPGIDSPQYPTRLDAIEAACTSVKAGLDAALTSAQREQNSERAEQFQASIEAINDFLLNEREAVQRNFSNFPQAGFGVELSELLEGGRYFINGRDGQHFFVVEIASLDSTRRVANALILHTLTTAPEDKEVYEHFLARMAKLGKPGDNNWYVRLVAADAKYLELGIATELSIEDGHQEEVLTTRDADDTVAFVEEPAPVEVEEDEEDYEEELDEIFVTVPNSHGHVHSSSLSEVQPSLFGEPEEPEVVGPHASFLVRELKAVRTNEALDTFITHWDLEEDLKLKRNLNNLEKQAVREALVQRASLIQEHNGLVPNNPDPEWGEFGIMRVTVGDGLPVLAEYNPNGIIPFSFHGPISSTGYRSGVPFALKERDYARPLELAQAAAEALHTELLKENEKRARSRKHRDEVVDLETITLEAQYAQALERLSSDKEYTRKRARAVIIDLEEVMPEKRGQADEAIRLSLDLAHQRAVLDKSSGISSTIATIEQTGERDWRGDLVWNATFKDGRFPCTVEADTELSAREVAIRLRAELESRGDRINEEGFYVQGVEEIPVPLPEGKDASVTILLVHDEIDSRWHYGVKAKIRGQETIFWPHVYGDSNGVSRHYAIENLHSYRVPRLEGIDEQLLNDITAGFNKVLNNLKQQTEERAREQIVEAVEAASNKPYVLNDNDDAPRIVFHGTNQSFNNFSDELIGTEKGDPAAYFGFAFTEEKEDAAAFGTNIVAAKIRAEKIYFLTWQEFEPFQNGTATIEEAKRLRESIIAQGYDAIELQDRPVLIPLSSSQIEIVDVTVPEVESVEVTAPNSEELAAELKTQIEQAQAERAARGSNYVIEDVAIHDAGAKQRFKWNVEAIETLRLIESEERAATEEEKHILARFSGFGSMPGAFNKYSDNAGQWTKERDQIKRLLTEEEYEAASRSTLNAHYTHPVVADAMWKAITRMGFEGGRVCEPAMGSGVFFGRIPEELRDKVQLTGVELDSITGRIAKLLYPQADIHVTGFQNVNPPDGWFDVVIGNFPFGSYNVHDPEYNKYNANIHDYFFLKSLDKVREGGMVVAITSMGTMDKQDSRIREKLAEKADLVAAVRLPCTAFEKNAGTEVVTDIIILQKRPSLEQRLAVAEKKLRQQEEISANADLKLQRAGRPDLYLESVYKQAREDAEYEKKKLETVQADVEWLKAGGTNGVDWTKVTTVEDPAGGEPIVVNEYYELRPEMIVGTLDRTGTMYHGENVNVHLEEGQNFDTELYYALTNVPRGIYEAEARTYDAGGIERLVTHNEKIKAGGYVVEEGKLYQRVKDVLKPCEASDDRIKRIEKLLTIRDTVRTLFNHELAGEMGAAEEVRARLNREYNQFKSTYGLIHSPKNVQSLQGDPDLPVLLALEKDYKPGTSRKPASAAKADIFTKPTLRGYQPPTSAENINEALSITLNEYGRLHISRICQLLDRDESQVGAELMATGLAYQNPRGLAWEIRDEYLSGNVRAKLVEAREAAKEDPRFESNVKALETVIPQDVDYVDIGVRLGSAWVPPEDVAAFMAHLVGGEPGDFTVKYASLTGSWTVGYSQEGAAKHRFKPAAVEIWGTDRADLIDVVQHACDARAIVVRDRVEKDRYILNKEDTEAANVKLAAVKAEFKEWIWTDPERRARLHRYYNDHFNNIAPKLFDGSHLTFPGMNPAVKLRKNQVDAIWRTITTGKAIYAHKVGRGKTYTMIAAAMEMKRLGLVEKPCISCLKGNIGEITAAAQHLYPGARILSTLGNFEKSQRKEIVAQMATGDYDLIIMTHDNLDMLPMYPETRAKYIKEELKELEETIYAAAVASGKDSNRLVKTLENAKAKLEADMLEILEKNKDDAVNFEETGIDFLFVDEFHKYKSLKVYTKQDRVKGIPTSRSDRATNMLARIRWLLEQHGGRGAVGATGTPISNTTAELFNLMRYFQWDELNERGIRSFDAWASVFGETVTKIERTATGSYKEVTRFAKFTNLPELIQLSHQVMDVCMEDVPEIKLPKRIDEVITSEMSREQHAYLQILQQRAEDLKGKYIKEKGADNMLAISNDARKMSLDMRLVSPYASDDPNNKVNNCLRDILQNLQEHPGVTQLVFSDSGVHENDWGFSVYKDLRDKLIAAGLKPEEVIDFSKLTEKQRKQAIEDLASGKAKVGIGSTDKLGTGTNVQYHLYASHNLDVHWLPSSQLQRDGRIERQGNKHAESGVPIRIKRYVTIGGFDEIMYTAVDRKINFINQIMRGDVNGVGREFVEVDGEELSAAQIAAIASGNPDVLRKVELEEEVGQLERSERRHRQSQLRLEDDARDMVVRIKMHERAVSSLVEDAKTLHDATTDEGGEKKEGFLAEIQGHEFTKRKDAGIALERAFSAAHNGDVLGTYKGFPICVRRGESAFGTLFSEMYLAGKYGQYEVNFATAEGIFTSMDASLRNIEKIKASNEEQIRVLQTNSEKIKDEIGKPFKDAEKLSALRAELVQVEKRLRDAGVANGTNVKTGKLTFEKCEYEVELRNHGVVKDLRPYAKNGGTVIKIDNKPVGWLKQDDAGALVAIEIKEEYRRHGVATRAVMELYQGKEFQCYAPNEQGAAWINGLGSHTVDEETGLLTVKPVPRQEPTVEKHTFIKLADGRITVNAFHTIRLDEEGIVLRSRGAQSGAGLYLAVDQPWTFGESYFEQNPGHSEQVFDKNVTLDPQKIFDPLGVIPGSNQAKSKADDARLYYMMEEIARREKLEEYEQDFITGRVTEEEYQEFKDSYTGENALPFDFETTPELRTEALKQLGYEAAAWRFSMDDDRGEAGRITELVVFDRSKVKDGHIKQEINTPAQQTEREADVIIVGYQTRVAVSREEQILERYAEITRIAEDGHRNLTGHELSSEARRNFGRMMLECAALKPTEEQEEKIQGLMEKQGLLERPEIIENQVDAAAWIARREPGGNEIWVNAALAAAREVQSAEQSRQANDVGKFHRGMGADRSYGVSLALDSPISREDTSGREVVDVRYTAIPKERIFDPNGIIKGTDIEQSRDDADALAARLVASKIPEQKQEPVTIAGYHTSVPGAQPDKWAFIQRGDGLYLALDKPFTAVPDADKAVVARKAVDINPAKIFDPNGLLAGTDVERSSRDYERFHDLMSDELKSVNLVNDGRRGIAQAQTRALQKLGYEAEVGWIDGPEGGNRELVIFDRERVRDISEEEAPEKAKYGIELQAMAEAFPEFSISEVDELVSTDAEGVETVIREALRERGVDVDRKELPAAPEMDGADEHQESIELAVEEAMQRYTDVIDVVIPELKRQQEAARIEPPILKAASTTDATDETARERTKILKELGYDAEARIVDGNMAAGQRELIVFDLQHVKTVERGVDPATVMERAPEWQESAENAHKQEQERPDREVVGRKVWAEYKLKEAEYQLKAACEQTDLRRYVVNFKGEKRRISVKDIENLAKAKAHRSTALVFQGELAKQASLPIGERKSARVLRMELMEKFTAQELASHADTIQELRERHEKVVTNLKDELEKAKQTYEVAVEDEVNVAAKYDGNSPAPILYVKELDELHNDAAVRRDAKAITSLDELRQNLISEFGERMQRGDQSAARLAAQRRMAELSERSSRNNLERFEETYHLRRFSVEGENRNDYMPEARGHNNRESRADDNRWSLQDVAKARKTVQMSQEWLTRNAKFYDGQASFKDLMARIADTHFNPITQLKMDAMVVTDPKRYWGYHLNPIRQIESNPVVQVIRFVKNYGSAKEQAEECRRLADLEARKLESLNEIESSVKEQIAAKRVEFQADLAEQTELNSALGESVDRELAHRAGRNVEMPKPQYEEYEIRRIEAHGMELSDGELLKEYEASAIVAKESGLLKEEKLPKRAIGREIVAETRVINAQAHVDNLDKVIETPKPPTPPPTGVEAAEPLRVKDVQPVRVNIDGEDRVLSLRDVPEEAAELREAVSEALKLHKVRLLKELDEARDLYAAAKYIADAYRNAMKERGVNLSDPQFNVKEHLEVERFAAGVEDDALYERYSEIAREALEGGNVMGIERSLTVAQTGEQSAEMQAQTAEFEQSLAANSANASQTALNALARSAIVQPEAQVLQGNTFSEQPASSLVNTPPGMTSAMPAPIITTDATSQLTDTTSASDTAAEVAQAAEVEAEAAATDIIEIIL